MAREHAKRRLDYLVSQGIFSVEEAENLLLLDLEVLVEVRPFQRGHDAGGERDIREVNLGIRLPWWV